jgi:hypothetical protein
VTSLAFVTPAYRRVALSAVCFRQHITAHDRLREHGIDATSIVIADDDNLDIARALGLLTVEHENRLGAKFNAGYQEAARLGFDYVMALGSDSFLDPAWLVQRALPVIGELVCSRFYTLVDETGSRQARLSVGYDGGIGCRMFRTSMLKACNFAPLEPDRPRGCDEATLAALRAHGPARCRFSDVHQFQVVGFQTPGVQVSSFSSYVQAWLVEYAPSAFDRLDAYYPAELLEQVRAYYTTARLTAGKPILSADPSVREIADALVALGLVVQSG